MNQTSTDKTAEHSYADVLRLSLVNGIGPRLFGQLIECFETPAAILSAAPSDLQNVPGIGSKLADEISRAREQIDVQPTIDLCEKHAISIVDRQSECYPRLLQQIHDPPSILFEHGELLPEDDLSIAIVGSRHATQYGRSVAEKLAGGLAKAGFTIVSGLARGIDSIAHRAALDAGGRTIAVLGSGLLNLYPPENAELAIDIQNNGAVISEMLPLQPPKSGAFPQRNRIVTGQCLGVVIVEAGERSGALISARLAMEQDREVFAVPGRIDSRMSRGCHKLLRDGAKLVESVDDILEELGPLSAPTKTDAGLEVRHPVELKLTDQEKMVLQSIGVEPTEIDSIVDQTGLPVSRILSTISVLEIRKLVKRVSGTSLIRYR